MDLRKSCRLNEQNSNTLSIYAERNEFLWTSSSDLACMSSDTHLCRKSGSTPTVGSSRIKSSGSCIRATAKDTRRCWPPLQSENNSVVSNGKLDDFASVHSKRKENERTR